VKDDLPGEPYSKSRRKKAAANDVALRLLEQTRLSGGHEAFLQDGYGLVYRYNGAFWQEIREPSLLRLAYEFDDVKHTSSRRRSEIISALKVFCHRAGHKWSRADDHEVPCKNGVVNVMTGQIRPHRPEDYFDSIIPHDFRPDANSPTLERALAVWFDDESERPDALAMFAGYLCLGHAKFKQALYCHGLKDTGKSQVGMLLRELVGADATCSLAIEEMDDPVKRSALKHMRLNLLTELPTDALIKDGPFKTMVSTGEPIFVNPKYEMPQTIVPYAKHVFISNDLPRIKDRTEATLERLLILHFDKVLPAVDQDRDLADKLRLEMGGVLAFAIRGARELLERKGQWPELHSAQALRKELRDDSNPVALFVQHFTEESAGAAIAGSDLAERFNRSIYAGRKMDVRQVGKLSRSAGYDWGDCWLGGEKRITAKGLRNRAWRTDSDLAAAAREAPWHVAQP
jgi:putative DNA primase/helicase